MSNQPTPSFLNSRRKAQKEAPTATAQPKDKPDAATATKTAKTAASDKTPAPGKMSGKRTGGKGKGGMQSADQFPPPSPSLTATLRAISTRPEMLDKIETEHPGVLTGALAAMARGAQIAGPSGVADRAALWKVVGMPWIGDAGSSGKTARDLGAALGAAYGEAVSRLEGHRRRGGVTAREPVTLEAVLDNA